MYRLRTKSERVAQAMAAHAVTQGIYLRTWQDRAGYWTLEVQLMGQAKRMQNGVSLEGAAPTIEYVSETAAKVAP